MIKECIFTSQNNFVVTFTALDNHALIHLDADLFLHLVSCFHQLMLIDYLNVKFCQHLIGVVRIIAAEFRVVIIDLEICLTEKVIETIALDGGVATHSLCNVVA